MDLRDKFHVWMARLDAERTKELAPERREQPAFDLRGVANLVRPLSKDKKGLLGQIARLRLVLGQREREPVKGCIKPA